MLFRSPPGPRELHAPVVRQLADEAAETVQTKPMSLVGRERQPRRDARPELEGSRERVTGPLIVDGDVERPVVDPREVVGVCVDLEKAATESRREYGGCTRAGDAGKGD